MKYLSKMSPLNKESAKPKMSLSCEVAGNTFDFGFLLGKHANCGFCVRACISKPLASKNVKCLIKLKGGIGLRDVETIVWYLKCFIVNWIYIEVFDEDGEVQQYEEPTECPERKWAEELCSCVE